MENPIKIDDFGGTTIFGNIHIDLVRNEVWRNGKKSSFRKGVWDKLSEYGVLHRDRNRSLETPHGSSKCYEPCLYDNVYGCVNAPMRNPQISKEETLLRERFCNFDPFGHLHVCCLMQNFIIRLQNT